MAKLYLGTCSWKYPSWEGIVYSSREPTNFLAEYTKKYNSVEVDQWFWSLGKKGASLPRRETVAEYDASTPPDFRFTIKCPNALTLTHEYARKGEPLVANPRFLDVDFFLRFLDSLAPLVPKTIAFMFQFEYLNQSKMPSKQAFVDRVAGFLDALPRDLPYAVEIRNPKWMDGAWFDLLHEHRAAPVLLQGYWMDDVSSVLDKYGNKMRDTICVRLHGEDREGMEEKTGEDWSKIVRPKDDEIQRIAGSLDIQYRLGKQIIVSFNNHFEGSAPITIEKFRKYFPLA